MTDCLCVVCGSCRQDHGGWNHTWKQGVEMGPYVAIRLPKASWNQIVDTIEDVCGTSRDNIEILQGVTELSDELLEILHEVTELRDGIG